MGTTALTTSPLLHGQFASRFQTDKQRIEQFLAKSLGADAPASSVTSAMRYAVLGEAQRVRPILALRLARMLRAETEHTLRAAAAVEILHAASLIVDDLPSMDNELMRRGKPATHIEFGEATATLAAFSLVAHSARLAVELPATEREFAQLRRFQLALLHTLDVSSLVGGQCLDLELSGSARDEKREFVNDLKTVPLFQLSVEAACVSLADGIPAPLKSFGRSFGLAFQLTDDYLDGEINESDKANLYRQYDRCREILAPYGPAARPIQELIDYLEERATA
jgi:geranylgeranyl pyrophosphate synthase